MAVDTPTLARGSEPAPTTVPAPGPSLAERARADGVRFLLAALRRPDRQAVRQARAGRGRRRAAARRRRVRRLRGRRDRAAAVRPRPDRHPGRSPRYTPLPWVREGLALVHCDPHVEGEPWHFAPRVILKRLDRRRGRAAAGAVRRAPRWSTSWSHAGRRRRARPGRRAGRRRARPCYDARGLTRMYDHLTAVSTAMNALGWGNYANDHEDAQRPVRAELRLRRRADHRRPGDHRAVPDLRAGRAAGHDRDVHAQAVRRPHRQRACTCTCRCGGTASRCSPTPTTPRGHSASPPLAYSLPRRGSSSTRPGCRPCSRRR